MDYKALVDKINGLFEQNNMADFLAMCTEDVSWDIIGHETIKGKGEMIDFMDKMGAKPFTTKILPNFIISDGNRAVSERVTLMTLNDGTTMTMKYCDIYLFEGENVKEMLSYCVEMKG